MKNSLFKTINSFILLILSLFIFFTTPSILKAQENNHSKLKILFLLPLSGETANLGIAFKNGFELALSENRDISKNIEVIYEDDMFIAKNAITALNRQLAKNTFDLVITSGSGTSKAIAPILEKKGIPTIAAAWDPEVSKGKKYVFNFAVTPDAEAEILIKIFKKKGLKNLARISTEAEGAISFNKIFDQLSNKEFNIITDESFTPEIKDFNSIITKLKNNQTKLDALFLFLYPGQVGTFAKQAKDLNFKIETFGAETIEDIAEVEIAQGGLEGVWFATNATPNNEFLDKFTKKFPTQTSFISYSATLYDLGNLLKKLILEKKEVNSEVIVTFFKSIKDYHGAQGIFSSTSDNRFTIQASIKIVKDGKFIEY